MQEEFSFFRHSLSQLQYQLLAVSLCLAPWRFLHTTGTEDRHAFRNETGGRMAKSLQSTGKSPGIFAKNSL